MILLSTIVGAGASHHTCHSGRNIASVVCPVQMHCVAGLQFHKMWQCVVQNWCLYMYNCF